MALQQALDRTKSLIFTREMVCQQLVDRPKASFLREKWYASKPWTSLKPYFYEKSITNRLDRASTRACLSGTVIFLLLTPLSENVNLLQEISSDVGVNPPRAIRCTL